tara:strand:- start:204 stop:746 length:543 start_codon:yes stop_codon:yes gene_type:complete
MNLVYSIPDKLYYFENFLDYPTYKKLHYDVFKSNLISLKSVKKDWDKKLTYGHYNFTQKTDLDKNNPLLIKLKILIKTNRFHKINYNNFNFVLHSMEDGAGINWHDDNSHEYGITYYINRRWNSKFGGELLFTHETANGFVPLTGNSLLVIKAPLLHKVVTVTKPIVPRKTIQIFVGKDV